MSDITLNCVYNTISDMKIPVSKISDSMCGFGMQMGDRGISSKGLYVIANVLTQTVAFDVFPRNLSVEKFAYINTLKLIQKINEVTLTGYFRIIDNKVVYTYSQFCTKEQMTPELIDKVTSMAAFTWNSFEDAIIPIARGKFKDPNEAFMYCIRHAKSISSEEWL